MSEYEYEHAEAQEIFDRFVSQVEGFLDKQCSLCIPPQSKPSDVFQYLQSTKSDTRQKPSSAMNSKSYTSSAIPIFARASKPSLGMLPISVIMRFS